MTLNLRLESDYLKGFEFTVNGKNFEQYADIIGNEFYNSRNLCPIRILIDGSPHTSQKKLGKLLSQFYCLHPIDQKCFLKFYQCRLVSSKSRVQCTTLKFTQRAYELCDMSANGRMRFTTIYFF